jgi:hypothetical protein
MYLQWTDRSLCETGFSFERGGAHFAPVYSVQDSTICGVYHSPTSVFDDLSAAQAQGLATIGSTQTYCVRATAPIGCDSNKYESEPACTSIVIAWESSIAGWVHGRDNTGKAPVKDVLMQWYFVSNPDIGGEGTTNADGHFIENNSQEIDINIQVCVVLKDIINSELSARPQSSQGPKWLWFLYIRIAVALSTSLNVTDSLVARAR